MAAGSYIVRISLFPFGRQAILQHASLRQRLGSRLFSERRSQFESRLDDGDIRRLGDPAANKRVHRGALTPLQGIYPQEADCVTELPQRRDGPPDGRHVQDVSAGMAGLPQNAAADRHSSVAQLRAGVRIGALTVGDG